jgi:hypothetical protein
LDGRSRVVWGYLAGQPEVVAEDLPGYAPERNLDEPAGCRAKYGRLMNCAAPDVEALRERVTANLEYLRRHPYSLPEFVDQTELPLAA